MMYISKYGELCMQNIIGIDIIMEYEIEGYTNEEIWIIKWLRAR